MDLRTKAIRGVAWSALRNWGSRALNFVVFAVLAQLLPQVAFGLVALAGTYVAFIRVFVDQGFADAIIQREDLEAAHLDTAFWVNLGLSLVMTGGSILAAPYIAQLFAEPDLAPVIQWLSPSFVLAALSGVQQAYIERRLEYRVLAVRELVAAVAGGTVGVGMALSGYGVWSLVGMMLSERVAAVFVLWTASDWRPGGAVSTRHFRELFRFGINILGSNLLYYVNSRADNLIIGYALGATALGYYDVAYKLFINGVELITLAVSSVAFSTFSRMQDDPDRMRQGFYTATRVVSVVAFPVFLGTAVVAPDLIGLLFGAKWLPLSAQVFQVLAFAGILQTIFYFNSPVMLASGKPQWRLGITVLNAVVNVVAFSLVVSWGIVAVAAAFVLRGYLLAPLQLWLVQKLIGIRMRTYFGQFITPVLGSGILVAVVWGITRALERPAGPIIALASAATLGAIVYVGFTYLFDRPLFAKLVDLTRPLSS